MRSSTTTTSATRPSWPRTWRPSTSCPAAGWTSRSAPAGTGPSTKRSACPSSRLPSARPASRRRSPSSRAPSARRRSRTRAPTTRSATLDGQPKPVQKPHPPFLIGGGGRRTLELAGREAQIVGLAPRILPSGFSDPRSYTLAASAEKIGWAKAAATAAGRDADALEFNVYPSGAAISVTDDARAELRELASTLLGRTGVEVSVDELLEAPSIMVGSIDGLVEKFEMLRERLGISSFMVGEIDELAPLVERLAGR